MPLRLAQFDNINEDIDVDDDDDYEEEEEEDIEELPSSKSPDISRFRNRRRGNQSICHGEQRSNVSTHFYYRRLTENRS